MKKGQFLEFVEQQLNGGVSLNDKSKKYTPQAIELAIGMAIQDIAGSDVRPGYENIINYLVTKSSSDVPVQRENGKAFFLLPFAPLSGAMSIKFVGVDINASPFSFHPSAPMYSMMNELKAGSMRNGFYPDNEKFVFHRDPLVDHLFVSMIPAFDEYNEEDEFVVGDQHMNLYGRVLEIMKPVDQRLLDNKNDNAVEDEQRGVRG